MKTELIGIAIILFMILIKLTDYGVDNICIFGGIAGLLIVILGNGKSDNK